MIALLTVLMLANPAPAKDLTARLLVIDRPGTIFQRWKQGEELASVTRARRGEPMAALILFTDCAPDRRGLCDVKVDMTIVDPRGKVYGEAKGSEVWVGKPAPARGATQPSVDYMLIEIEPKDPRGKYVVKAHVTDRISQKAIDRQWTFDVGPVD